MCNDDPVLKDLIDKFNALNKKYILVTSDEYVNKIKADAYIEGFKLSGQGFNGEHGAVISEVLADYIEEIRK